MHSKISARRNIKVTFGNALYFPMNCGDWFKGISSTRMSTFTWDALQSGHVLLFQHQFVYLERNGLVKYICYSSRSSLAIDNDKCWVNWSIKDLQLAYTNVKHLKID